MDCSPINQAEGYSIDNQNPGQKITLMAANPSPDVTVRLRPRGAVLIGTVRDKISGEPVNGISVQYLDVDGKASGSSPFSDGEFRVALPTQCDLAPEQVSTRERVYNMLNAAIRERVFTAAWRRNAASRGKRRGRAGRAYEVGAPALPRRPLGSNLQRAAEYPRRHFCFPKESRV